MNREDLDDLARAHVLLRQTTGIDHHDPRSDAHFWAHDRVSEIVQAGGGEAVEVIDHLLHADGADDDYLAYCGAGPIEDLLYAHGADVAGLIAERCRVDDAWRSAVSAVYGFDLPAEVLRALDPYFSRGA